VSDGSTVLGYHSLESRPEPVNRPPHAVHRNLFPSPLRRRFQFLQSVECSPSLVDAPLQCVPHMVVQHVEVGRRSWSGTRARNSWLEREVCEGAPSCTKSQAFVLACRRRMEGSISRITPCTPRLILTFEGSTTTTSPLARSRASRPVRPAKKRAKFLSENK
jgi:hypothetical protein